MQYENNIPSRVAVLPPRTSKSKTSPAFIKGPVSEPEGGVKVIFVGPVRGHRVAKTQAPAGVTFKLR
jgi:hypothetical protein